MEIALGVQAGAVTIGVATDEINREGINPAKRERLLKAGAHIINGDFFCGKGLMELVLNTI